MVHRLDGGHDRLTHGLQFVDPSGKPRHSVVHVGAQGS